ncbi:MAG: LuxR C-terminal-related transcriptional regulator [Nocardioidaceae bacterium]
MHIASPTVSTPPDRLGPLRGRSDEVNAICSLLGSVRPGSGVIVALEGPSGIGKTRLLEEAQTDTTESDLLVSSIGNETLDRSVPLCYLISVLGELPADLVQNYVESSNPYRLSDWLYDRIAADIKVSGREAPTLILLDDLHEADEASLVVLRLVIPRLLTLPVAFVLARGTAPTNARADQLFDKLEKWGGTRIWLGPLSASYSVDIARDVAPELLNPAVRSFVHRAAGNPRLVVDLMKGLRDESGFEVITGDVRQFRLQLPDRLHETVRQQVDRLTERAALMLRVAAFIGVSCIFGEIKDRLSAHLPMEEVALLRYVHEAKRAGLLYLADGHITFTNPLVWQSLAEGGGVLLSWEEQGEDSGSGELTELAQASTVQQKIATLVSEGKTNQQIARQLFMSPHTVDTHLRRMFKKFNIHSRVDLARLIVSG